MILNRAEIHVTTKNDTGSYLFSAWMINISATESSIQYVCQEENEIQVDTFMNLK